MSFRYPVPNEEQAERLRANGMDPSVYMIRDAENDGTMWLQCYKTGDEIRVTPNVLKKNQKNGCA